jgi:hypothetical protein
VIRRVTKVSAFTGRKNSMHLPIAQEQVDRFCRGEGSIHEVFGSLRPSELEFLVSGVTPMEWDARAAEMIDEATAGAHVVGAVPSFDTERLAKLMRRAGITPSWHYHLIDVENLAVGWLAARGETPSLPWRSDVLSKAVGVDPGNYARHTAMGDVQWVRDQYDAMMHREDGFQ